MLLLLLDYRTFCLLCLLSKEKVFHQSIKVEASTTLKGFLLIECAHFLTGALWFALCLTFVSCLSIVIQQVVRVVVSAASSLI